METAITALIVIGVMVLSIIGISNRALSAQAVISESSRVMQEREGERLRTNLSTLGVTTADDGSSVQVTLRNTGMTKLMDLPKWDVILQYADGGSGQVKWYPYGVAVNEWNHRIYQNASSQVPEVVEPGILNPGEELLITVNVSPPVAPNSTNLATITTPNGVTVTAVFTH